MKLNSTGSQILYATYLGGGSDDSANAIAVDALGNVYVAGSTASSAFPVTEGAFQTTYKGNVGQPTLPRFGMPFRRLGDVFVTKINPGGTQLIYSTLLGGQREEARAPLPSMHKAMPMFPAIHYPAIFRSRPIASNRSIAGQTSLTISSISVTLSLRS